MAFLGLFAMVKLPKHRVAQYVETGDEELLDDFSKSDLIVTMNALSGYDREDDEGNPVPFHMYNNTPQKEELIAIISSLYGYMDDADDLEEAEEED